MRTRISVITSTWIGNDKGYEEEEEEEEIEAKIENFDVFEM